MKKLIYFSVLGLTLLVLPTIVLAQTGTGDWELMMNNAFVNTPPGGFANTDLVTLIFRIIQYVLTFLGVVAVVVIIIGGFQWMTAAGNEDKVAKGKKTLIQGIIGLIIILLAFAIASFVINQLTSLGRP